MTLDLPTPSYAHYLALHALVVVGGVAVMSGLMVAYMECWKRWALHRAWRERAEAQRGWKWL